MILVSAGTEHGFDRLFRAMDALVARGEIADRVLGQIGRGSYVPEHFESFRFLPYEEFAELLASVSILVAHTGMGCINQACDLGIPSVVVPRDPSLREHVNDHQRESARLVESEGLAIVAWYTEDLLACLEQARSFRPVIRKGDTRLANTIRGNLRAIARGWRPGRGGIIGRARR